MKTRIFVLALLSLLMITGTNLSAQNKTYSENHGGTFNFGLGIGGYSGYYGYVGHTLPVFNINYEFDVAQNFTLAPFISFYSYRNDKYYYNETVIPIGVKGTYYFDQILNANSNWDFYLAGSLGFAVVNSRWDSGYYRDDRYYHEVNPLFLDLHIGAEYHLSNRVGLFLDLSTGVSTIGLALH
ncbi:MAG: hypothetical protein Q8S54_04695 [Bacteroidota bacterium]|nr:hypothetical protein [Odoribacter sp.]MDP3642472.1 hypothetical protein [Bacteroidota bacterium]